MASFECDMTQIPHLTRAADLARLGKFRELRILCKQILEASSDNIDILIKICSLLYFAGFVYDAKYCAIVAARIDGQDPRPVLDMANIARDIGDHEKAQQLYANLLESWSEHSGVRRNFLLTLEYDPMISDKQRRNEAMTWGAWAVSRAGGEHVRPSMRSMRNRKLHIGYVSPDFCQHTVGLFLRNVLKAHDNSRVKTFAYNAGQSEDWVTKEIQRCCIMRDISGCGDTLFYEIIAKDRIDILVDLSGHTAGSKLTAFAYRPAPVMVSWLGYFATTGLPCMDAVLLDKWHAPEGTEAQFVEPIIRLPHGRFCFQPVPWAPGKTSLPPFVKNGYITFGCFNNTAKLNKTVFDVWAEVLRALPDARLILKWRTFNDEAFCEEVTGNFTERGISTDRIELRGPSFHADLLNEYADVDIALDPFPFTGGLTSCEALWMGVPVVTWPQSRVVSRQTYAILNQINFTELAASDAGNYVRIAIELACNKEKLLYLRSSLREMMRNSPLMDVNGFTRHLEETLIDLYRKVEAGERTKKMKTFLHIGCGLNQKERTTAGFNTDDWREVRFDIDEGVQPDLIGSMTDLSEVDNESMDAVFSSHNIEHLYPHEVPLAFKEFFRVLKPEGFLVATCPDLKSVCAMVAEDKLLETAYIAPAGPIAPIDILYGYRPALAEGNFFMAHRCGFTQKVLDGTLHACGFRSVASRVRPGGPFFDLWVIASKSERNEDQLRAMVEEHFPS